MPEFNRRTSDAPMVHLGPEGKDELDRLWAKEEAKYPISDATKAHGLAECADRAQTILDVLSRLGLGDTTLWADTAQLKRALEDKAAELRA